MTSARRNDERRGGNAWSRAAQQGLPGRTRCASEDAATPAGPVERRGSPSGYLHPGYAASFSEWGTPWALPRAGGWAPIRQVPGSVEADAMGCYPLLTCTDWSGLAADLEDGVGRAVAFSAVVDPLAVVAEEHLRAAFPHVLRRFKDHFVVELACRVPVGSAEHRRKARRARARVDLDLREDARPLLNEWTSLYALLIQRHGIRGMRAFSHASFAAQLGVPGMRAVRAEASGKTVGITLWAEHGDNVYYHLGAQKRSATPAPPLTRCSTRRSPGSASVAVACWTWARAPGWSAARTV